MDWLLFITFLAACSAPAAAGMLFRPAEWYRDLSKPPWTPPNWMFPVVWTFLYITMSVAAARVAVLPGSGQAIALWAVQIALGTLWSGVFFGLHRMVAGGVILSALWLAVAGTTAMFWQLDTLSGVLLLPYLVWGTVALALNWSIWARNRVLA